MKKNKSYIWNLILIIIITFLVIGIVLKSNLNDVKSALAKLNFVYLGLSLLMVLAWQYTVALLLRSFASLRKKNYSRKEGMLNALVASFFHNITPSSSGGQFAQIYVFKTQGIGTGDAASILWAEFIIYQTTMCLLGLFLIIIRFKYFYSHFSNMYIFIIIGFILNSLIIIFLYALGCLKNFKKWFINKGVYFAYKLHLVKNLVETQDKVVREIAHFDEERKKLNQQKMLIFYSAFLCLLRLIISYSIPFVLFAALGVKPSFDLFFNCLVVGSFVSLAGGLVPIPGGSGGIEAIFIAMYTHFFSLGLTTTAMLLWRFFTFYLLLIIGGLSFFYIRYKEEA